MKLRLAGLALLASQSVFAGGLLFDVQSSQEALTLPITLCLDGLTQFSCQNYTANGLDLNLQTRTTRTTQFTNAGIRVNTSGYKLSGCTPNANGFFLFAVSSYSPTHIVLR